VYSALFYQR